MRRCLVALNAFGKLKRSSRLTRFWEFGNTSLGRNIMRPVSSTTHPADVSTRKFEDVQTGHLMSDLAKQNASSVTTTQLLAALSELCEPIKNNLNQKLVEEARLQLLCTHLLKKIRFFQLQEIISIIYSLVLLKVPADSVVLQSFLQILRAHVNELNYGQIYFLTSILRKATPTPLVKALKLALPIVAHNHLDMQMDRTDPTMLAKLFSYAGHNKFSTEAIKKISVPLMNLSAQWTYSDAMKLLWGAVFLRSPLPDFGDLIMTATNIVIDHASEIPRDALMQLMARLESSNLLSEPLLKATSRKAILENWTLESVHALLWLMSQVSFLDVNLLEFYAVSLENRFSSQDLMPLLNLQEVVAVFARPNFVSHNMRFLLKEFIKQKDQINVIQSKPDSLVRFALDLTILGAYPLEVSNLLHGSHECLCKYSKMGDKRFLKNIALLKTIMGNSLQIQALDTLTSEMRGELLSLASERARAKGFPLKLALKKSLEHQPYQLYNGIVTNFGVYFDHLLVNMENTDSRTTNESISSNKLHIVDELQPLISDTSVRLAILVNSNENYASNAYHHNGETELTILALKKEGFKTVQINLGQWNDLQQPEKIPYLMREIEKLTVQTE